MLKAEELSKEERWLIETMVFQMDLLVSQMEKNPIYKDYANDWFYLKEKLGFEDIV